MKTLSFKSLLALVTSFGLLSVLLTGCGSSSDSQNSSLLNLFGEDSSSTSTETSTDPEEVPQSEGPKSIPSDLIPNGAGDLNTSGSAGL